MYNGLEKSLSLWVHSFLRLDIRMIQFGRVVSGGRRDRYGRALPLTIASFLYLNPLGYNDAMNNSYFHDWLCPR